MERVKNMRPEAQIRLEYYLTNLHSSLDHEVYLQIRLLRIPGHSLQFYP